MATEMTPQERADLKEIARKLVLQINEITPMQWDKHDDKDQAIVLAALQTTRRAALLEAAHKVRDRALLWRSHGGAKVGFPYGHLTIEGEYESMADELARLASEGG